MSKKIIIVILIVIVVGGLGYLIYQSMPKEETKPEEAAEEEAEDEISILLEELEQETGIDFSEIEEAEIFWIVKVDPKLEEATIEGKGFEVEGISDLQGTKIENFLESRGFVVDIYNVADGTIVGAVGYKKDQIVCSVVEGFSGYKEATGEWIPPDPNKRDVEVKCGKLEQIGEEQACISSGGTVTTGMCCKSTSDFPNLCLIGPCGCAPENSHEVKICDCGEDKCFNESECVLHPLE